MSDHKPQKRQEPPGGPNYTDESEITTFKRVRTDLEALMVGQPSEECIETTEHALQFKRQDGETFRRIFIDDQPLQTTRGFPIYEHEITSMEGLCEILDRGDEELDRAFKEEDQPSQYDRDRIIDDLYTENRTLRAIIRGLMTENKALRVSSAVGVN